MTYPSPLAHRAMVPNAGLTDGSGGLRPVLVFGGAWNFRQTQWEVTNIILTFLTNLGRMNESLKHFSENIMFIGKET